MITNLANGGLSAPSPLPARILSRCLILVCPLFLVSAASAQEVQWRTEYGKAMKEAAEDAKPLFVNVGTESCYWCKQLDGRTFKDEETVKLINERYIPLKLDATRSAYIVQALRVQSYPTLIFAAPDGSIVGFKEGFMEAAPLREQLLTVLTAVGTPDWMKRDFDAATRGISLGDYAKAMTLLRTILEDGKARPVQVKARKLLDTLEKQAAERTEEARELANQGKTAEAIAAINQLHKVYPGTLAAREGKQLLGRLTSKVEFNTQERKRQAEELLKQAQEDYKSRQLLCCLDRCEILSAQYADFPEGAAADKLASEIKSNPDWAKQACEQLGERLCVLYLALADSWLKKGQPQQALFYLDRVVKMFPGTRQAELAQVRLARLRGAPETGSANGTR